MFNNKIINIITRILGAIFLLFLGYLAIEYVAIILKIIFALAITVFIYFCIINFVEWLINKLDKQGG